MSTPPAGRNRVLDALTGLLAAGAGIGLGHLVAALVEPQASPVLAVGGEIVDRVPTPVKAWAVARLGTADKPVLVGAVLLVTLALAAVAGLVHRRRPGPGAAIVVLLCGVAVVAAVVRPAAGLLAPLPGLAAALGGVLTLRGLQPGAGAPAVHPRPTDPGRRRLLAMGGAGVTAATLGGAGQALIARSAPTQLALPAPADALAPLPPGLEGRHRGISPFVTPTGRFYRVDTALALPRVDPARWRLRIDGDVARPVEITLDELLAMDLVERDITMTCVSHEVGGEYVGSARWLGVPTRELLERAGVRPAVDQILSTSADGMTISTPVEALTDDRDALVAVGMNGAPLPRAHGFPVRLVTPRLYGFVGSTKWLTSLTATSYAAREAYWTERGWSVDAPVLTQSRIDTPRPLAPLAAGRVVVGGVAWAQGRGVERVEVRVDRGPWRRASLGPDAGVDYWRQWYLVWDARAGRHELGVRATDGEGATQPERRETPFPSGATGWHRVTVVVE